MENKNECEIVQDLLLNYVDGVLASSSRELVENHIKKCKKCQEKLEDIRKDEKAHEEVKEEIDYLKKVKRKISKKNKIIIAVVIILILIIAVNIIAFIGYNKAVCKLEIFLSDDITDEQLSAIVQTVQQQDKNAQIEYKSKDQALEGMKQNLGDNAYLLNEYEEHNIFPASYVVETERQYLENIENSITSLPGVKQINIQEI